MSKHKGARYERATVNALYKDGWVVIRAPSSGSATDHELPDVIAGRGAVPLNELPNQESPRDGSLIRRLVGEVKYRSDGRVRVKDAKMAGLNEVANAFSAVPVIVCRWKGDTTGYFVTPSGMDETRNRNFTIGKEQARENAVLTLPVKP